MKKYKERYLKEEWITVNPRNRFSQLRVEFIPHYFSSFEECVKEAIEASRHLSEGHYYAFEPCAGIFSWVRSDILGRVYSHEIDKAVKLAPTR